MRSPRKNGATTVSPASWPPMAGPASYSSACAAVCTTMAWPCPTSSIQIRACPAGTVLYPAGHSNGSHSGRKAAGSNSSNTAKAVANSTQISGTAPCQAGHPCTNQASHHQSACNDKSASCNIKPPTSGQPLNNNPSSTSGSSKKLTKGTATRLASGPTQLTGKPVASNKGSRPAATAHCARPNTCHHCQRPKRAANTSNKQATAEKDSQKPACSITMGSSTSTVAKASSQGFQSDSGR